MHICKATMELFIKINDVINTFLLLSHFLAFSLMWTSPIPSPWPTLYPLPRRYGHERINFRQNWMNGSGVPFIKYHLVIHSFAFHFFPSFIYYSSAQVPHFKHQPTQRDCLLKYLRMLSIFREEMKVWLRMERLNVHETKHETRMKLK